MKKLLDFSINKSNITDDLNSIKINEISDKDIAIIGLSLKFASAQNAEMFWQGLSEGIDYVRSIPECRMTDVKNYLEFMDNSSKNIGYLKIAYLNEIDKFDYNFFNISPIEARLMDPCQRIFLQTAYEALEDAGYGGNALVGSKTGVYVGFSGDSPYKKLIADVEPNSIPLALAGNIESMIASRLSYFMDFKGPSMLINTACSSALVATHIACKAIRDKECDIAVCGSIKINLIPVDGGFRLGIESSNDKTSAFDYDSDGTGGGEGVAAIVLKPLNKAVKDGDNIYALIKGSAVNQDGSSIGITAPNPISQKQVIIEAWKNSRVEPETISYIEAHGTGTVLGDPIEIESLSSAFKEYSNKKQFCALGTVKTNIGHLDHAAGIAGLLKAVLALNKKQVPPSLSFMRPNKKINFVQSPIYINDTLRNWDDVHYPRRCGISSMGISGTNCHIVLEEAIAEEIHRKFDHVTANIFTLSAKSSWALKELIIKYKEFVKTNKFDLTNVCYTACTGRGHYNYRIAIVVNSEEDFINKLSNINIGMMDSINNIQGFYGEHKIVPAEKSSISENELTEIMKMDLDMKADGLINRVLEANEDSQMLLTNLCNLYVQGADINWDKLYKKAYKKRVSIPTYPFQPLRCWVNTPDRQLNKNQHEHYEFCKVEWKKCQLILDTKLYEKKTILIFKDERTFGDNIAEVLRKEGNIVIEVTIGKEYKQINNYKYEIDNNQDSYYKLFKDIEDIECIIHLLALNVNDNTSSLIDLEKNLNMGVYSLFYLNKAIAKSSMQHEIDTILVTQYACEVSGEEKVIYPENAILHGLGKTISMENLSMKCRVIDIDEFTGIEYIISEIKAGYSKYKIAFRNSEKYLEELNETKIQSFNDDNFEINSNGVYVITGGLGGLGLETAQYLSSKNKVNLTLVSRTPMPQRNDWNNIVKDGSDIGLIEKIKILQQIESNGSEVVCHCADISNQSEVKLLFEKLKKTHGKINGVIHCAGVGVGRKGMILEEQNKDDFESDIVAKVHGTWIIWDSLKSCNLDFFILFSSPITLIGGVGAGGYTCANSYLDSFAQYGRKSNIRMTSISWAPWQNTVKKMGSLFNESKQLFTTMNTMSLLNNFEQILNKDLTSIIAGKINYDCELFLIQEQLPFVLSNSIENNIKKSNRQSSINEESLNSYVSAKGRDSKVYSPIENELVKIFGNILGYDEIDIFDNFFELGGDSIIATRICNRVNKKMNLDIKISDLLKNLTIYKFAEYLQSRYFIEQPEKEDLKFKKNINEDERYVMSHPQKRLYLQCVLKSSDTSYNIPMCRRIEGRLDIKKVERIINKIVERHEILRTGFELTAKDPLQRVYGSLKIKVEHFESTEENVDNIINRFIRPFDLGALPLFRIGLIKIDNLKYILLFDMHHIICDGQSLNILFSEFAKLYDNKELPELNNQYKDFSRWQNELINTEAYKKQKEYWMNVLQKPLPILNLPIDFNRTEVQSFKGNTLTINLNEELTKSLRKMAAETDSTLFMILLSVYYILLAKYSHQEDIVIASPSSGRVRETFENMLGVFINILALRNFPKTNKTFAAFLNEVKENCLRAYENQDYQFDDLINELNLERDQSRGSLCDVMFVMNNVDDNEIAIEELVFKNYEIENRTAKYDITLEVKRNDNSLILNFEYCSRLFKLDTIDKFVKSYVSLIRQVLDNRECTIEELKVLDMETTGESLSRVFQFKEKMKVDFDF